METLTTLSDIIAQRKKLKAYINSNLKTLDTYKPTEIKFINNPNDRRIAIHDFTYNRRVGFRLMSINHRGMVEYQIVLDWDHTMIRFNTVHINELPIIVLARIAQFFKQRSKQNNLLES